MVGHLDLDYFYAQVEEVEDPSLKSLPLIVCVYSGRTEDSGVVSTANYKARECGVRSGMPISFAKTTLSACQVLLVYFIISATRMLVLTSGASID